MTMEASNAMALREALENLVNHHCRNCPEDTQYGCGVNIGGLLGFKCTLLKQARAALAMPARNCDVGTAEEQWTRFERQCEAHRLPTDHDYCSCSCKVDGGCVNECAIIWAQMPYDGKEKENG